MDAIGFVIRSCLSKRHLSKDKADKIIDYCAKQNLLLYYYKCQLCSSYHLTKRVPDETLQAEHIA